MKESIKASGHITLTKKDAKGNVVDKREIRNLIVTAGKEEMASLLIGGGTAFSHIALGSGNTTPAVGDTALDTELTADGAERASANTTTNANVSEFDNTFQFTDTVTIRESGLFNAASAGTLLARQVFDELNFANGDQLNVKWEITFQ